MSIANRLRVPVDIDGLGKLSLTETLVWAAISLGALVAILVLNGMPLFYFDSAGYLAHGNRMFEVLGLFQPDPVAGAAAGGGGTDDGTVIGSRSAVYALFLSYFAAIHVLWVACLIQAILLLLILHVCIRLILRQTHQASKAWKVTGIATLAAALGSAGFYTAYLMPDIFAPIMLLAIAALSAFVPVLRFWQIIVLLIFGATAVVMHPSHLAVALVMVPGAWIATLCFGLRGWWKSGLFVLAIAGVGLAERSAFVIAVESRTDSEVVDLPFFTARLISDGPGKRYLDRVCPRDGMVTCDLNALLTRPTQLSPDYILFATDPEIGSFALLDPAQKRAVSGEQRGFLLAVATSDPLGVLAAVLRNTFYQLGLVSIDMTVPDQAMLAKATSIYADFPPDLGKGRLVGGGDWVATLTYAQQIYYGLAALVLIGLIVLPQSRLPRSLRAFGILIILGLLANAFVTGAISQPAHRYGARVIFLIPVAAVMLAMARQRFRPDRDA
jgi:hypothetical protein